MGDGPMTGPTERELAQQVAEMLDICNAYGVATVDGYIGMVFPPIRMSPPEALVHAAWLVVMAEVEAVAREERTGDDAIRVDMMALFEALVDRVRNT